MRHAALLVALALGACGFHPLYAPQGGNNAALQRVFVGVIANRNGQLLRQALQARLEGAGADAPKTFVLDVSLAQAGEAVSYAQDNSSSRERDVATAYWSLRRADAPGARLTSGTARAVDGHDVLNAQFFYADLQTDAATRRLADAVADQITQAIATYFRNHPA